MPSTLALERLSLMSQMAGGWRGMGNEGHSD
jgi:hypothetical protein